MSETITVTVPAALRPQVEGKDAIELEGETVGQVLESIKSDYPAFGGKLFPNGGDELHKSINIYVNEENIAFLEKFETKVTARDQVDIILAIAGG